MENAKILLPTLRFDSSGWEKYPYGIRKPLRVFFVLWRWVFPQFVSYVRSNWTYSECWPNTAAHLTRADVDGGRNNSRMELFLLAPVASCESPTRPRLRFMQKVSPRLYRQENKKKTSKTKVKYDSQWMCRAHYLTNNLHERCLNVIKILKPYTWSVKINRSSAAELRHAIPD